MEAVPRSVQWMVALMSGPLVVSIVTIAVAFVGLRMLSRRLPLRRVGGVVIGSFILMSATQIAQALVNFAPRTAPSFPAFISERPSSRVLPSVQDVREDNPDAREDNYDPFDPYGTPGR